MPYKKRSKNRKTMIDKTNYCPPIRKKSPSKRELDEYMNPMMYDEVQ